MPDASDPTEGTARIVQESNYYPFGMEIIDPKKRFTLDGANNYLYNGKELQDEEGLNLYDYGARFYDPVIGRWNVIDPKAESFQSMSPYNYAGDDPVKNLDSDGQQYRSSLLITNLFRPDANRNRAGLDEAFESDILFNGLTDDGKSKASNAGSAANKGGGEPTGGKAQAINASFAFGGGYSFELGYVEDAQGNSKWYYSHGPVIGLSLGLGYTQKAIKPVDGKNFSVKNYAGAGSGYSLGLGFAGVDYSGNRNNASYKNSDFKPSGENYSQLGMGVFTGLDLGVSWSRTTTRLFGK